MKYRLMSISFATPRNSSYFCESQNHRITKDEERKKIDPHHALHGKFHKSVRSKRHGDAANRQSAGVMEPASLHRLRFAAKYYPPQNPAQCRECHSGCKNSQSRPLPQPFGKYEPTPR